jgi:hypothetical protein
VRKVNPAQRISTVAFPIKNIESLVKSSLASEFATESVISLLEGAEAIQVPYLFYYRILRLNLMITTEFLCHIYFSFLSSAHLDVIESALD